MRGGRLPSPIENVAEVSEVLARFGSDFGTCITALESLAGSLVRYSNYNQGGAAWVFRHPTVEDAVGAMLRQNPELLGIYLRGSAIDELINQISCGDVGLEHALVVPRGLYGTVLTKLRAYAETLPGKVRLRDEWGRINMFLARRCDNEFLGLCVPELPIILDRVANPPLALESATEVDVAVRLFEAGLFPEEYRKAFVETICSYAVEGDDASALANMVLRKMFVGSEWDDLLKRVRSELVPRLGAVRGNWESYSDSDPESIMQGFLDLVSAVRIVLPQDKQIHVILERQRESAEAWIAEHTDQPRPIRALRPLSPGGESPTASRLIERSLFDDVDA
jgi:hypothetical protein